MHMYFMKVLILSGDLSRSVSSFEVKGQINIEVSRFTFWLSRSNFFIPQWIAYIFKMHMYFMKPLIFSGDVLRSISSFKVKSQIYI